MKQSMLGLTTLFVCSLMLSACTSMKPRDLPSEPLICEAGAIVEPSDFVMEELQTNSDKEFHKNAAVTAAKYPVLLGAYVLLLDCWNHYKQKQ